MVPEGNIPLRCGLDASAQNERTHPTHMHGGVLCFLCERRSWREGCGPRSPAPHEAAPAMASHAWGEAGAGGGRRGGG